jgi:iduronate 2-sulfatase
MHPGEYAIINRDWRYIRYGEEGEELYDLNKDPNEWTNLAGQSKYADLKIEMASLAPKDFAPPAKKMHAGRDLFVKDGSFQWMPGKGNLQKVKVYRPAVTSKVSAIKPKTKRKNILFVVCDDLNTHVSSSGYKNISTPNLTRLANESITFNRAFCQYPVCGPSRASFLSGLYPQSTGVLNNTFDIRKTRPGTVSMPQFFKQNGYWTAGVGKVFHNTKSDHGDMAWHENLRFENDELAVVREARLKFENEHGSIDKQTNKKKWKELKKRVSAKLDAQTPPGRGRSGLTDDQHKDGKNARQVVQWLEDKSYGDKPFFISLGLQKPHVPFLAPDKYFDLYPFNKITYQNDRPNLWDFLPSSALSKRYEAFGFEFAKENHPLRKEYIQAYHACVSFIDAQLGLVIDSLKKQGLWEDTVIVFTSDHGYHLGDHFIWGKVTLFDIGAKVPFIVRAPGLSQSGTASEAMVELIDIYPTLADLAGLKAPDHLQGISLRPLLGHPERLGKRKYAYSVVTRGPKNLGYALRNQNWRYGKWPDGEELYNLRTDPQEKNNLAQKDHLKERLKDFRDILAEKQNLFGKN